MTKHKASIIYGLLIIFIFGTAAQSKCDSKKNKNAANSGSNGNAANGNKQPVETPPQNAGGELKTLAEGSYGKIEQPFLYVVRSVETYRQMQSVIAELPSSPGIDFNKQAIIAAFAGTKNSGGYSVEIKNSGEKILISVVNPPPGAIVTEALTMPYKVVIVPIEAENELNLDISAEWKNAARTYNTNSGEFESSGGFAGRLKKFAARGTIDVWQFGNLITFDFNLSGEDANARLSETASGTVQNGKINLARLDAGSFSEGPKPPLKVDGTISANNLALSFEPLPTNVRDGFQVSGKLEAAAVR